MKQKNQNIYFFLISHIWEYAGNKKWLFIVHFCAQFIANLFLLSLPYIFGLAVNVIQEGGENMLGDFGNMLLLLLGARLGFHIFHNFTGRLLDRELGFYCERNFKMKLYDTVVQMPMERLQDNHSGKIIDQINRGGASFYHFIGRHFKILEVYFKIGGSVVVMYTVFPYMGLLALLFGMIIVLFSLKMDAILVEIYKKKVLKEYKVASLFHDYISNITTVITLRLEKLTKSEMVHNIMKILPIDRKRVWIGETKRFLNSMISLGMRLLVVFLYCFFTLDAGGTILIGTLVMLYEYTGNMDKGIQDFNNLYSEIVTDRANIEMGEKIKEEDRQIQENSAQATKSFPKRKWEKIEINNLSFQYNNAHENKSSKLQDINLLLEKGKKIAFIGESGSGKTTVLKIIRGIYNSDSADIIIDGKHYKNINLANITTLLPQEPDIFENTIEYNVSVGIKTTKKEILKDIQMACFSKVLEKLPKGLKTNINEKGVNFSGGENQRLAIARGLFASKKSDILLLDEPTSSVDPENERQIYKNIFEAFPEKCIISSVHKHYLLEMFDYVYVFERGKLIKEGTPKDLKFV